MIAEELIKIESNFFIDDHEEISNLMIKFAKYHVKLALQEALESIPCLGSSSDIPSYEEVENEVLNCYSLDNIK